MHKPVHQMTPEEIEHEYITLSIRIGYEDLSKEDLLRYLILKDAFTPIYNEREAAKISRKDKRMTVFIILLIVVSILIFGSIGPSNTSIK